MDFDKREKKTKPFKIEKQAATAQEKHEQKVVFLENLYLVVRFVGSCIVATDLFLKIMYFEKSKFSSYYLKDLYYYFLCLRPFLLLATNFYNWCLNIKKSFKAQKKLEKKYKDDVAW